MKNDKDFIVKKEDMNNQEEFTTEKKQRKGIKKYCIFASAVVLFGTVAGISLNKGNKIKDDISIESTSNTYSLDNSDVNSENEQVPVILRFYRKARVVDDVIKKDNEDVIVYKDLIMVIAESEILISKTDKEVIAIKLVNPKMVKKDYKMENQIIFTDLQLIYAGESIPNDNILFVKQDFADENSLPIYGLDERQLMENNFIESEQSSKTK